MSDLLKGISMFEIMVIILFQKLFWNDAFFFFSLNVEVSSMVGW